MFTRDRRSPHPLPARQARWPGIVTLTLALCATAALAQTGTEPAAQETAELAADLANRYVQPTLTFKPCADNATLDCALLTVPVDYAKPWAGTVGLAVIRARATAPGRRIGVPFANPGGPAGSGVDFIAQGVNAPGFIRLRERFDIVSFDVRGSHRSQPVRCDLPTVADPQTVPAAQLPQLFDGFSRDVAANCLRQNGSFINTLTSNNIARDIEVLRRALHERQISYVGLSYGTVLGAAYASLFPRSVRAMLLDGGLSPDFSDARVEFRSEQALSFETVFQHLDQRCKADPACRLRGAGVSTTMEELLARLTAAPVTSGSGVVLGAGSLRKIVGGLLPTESLWPFIVDGLADARNGDFTLMFQLLSFIGGNPPAGGGSFTAFNAVLCNDFGTRRPAAEVLPVSEAISAVSSRVDGRFAVATSAAFCAQWPQADPPIIRNLRGQLAAPILLIGTHFDPNTPLSWTRSLANALGMERQVLRYQGGGHTAYARFGNACIDRAGDAYLFDLTLPAPGASCPARPLAFTLAPASALRAGGNASSEKYWPDAR